MKQAIFSIVLIFFQITFSWSQCFFPPLVNQAAVDDFPNLDCTEVNTISISGADILNVDSLYPLISAVKIKIFSYANLTNLDGLYNLVTVEEDFELGGDDVNNVQGLTSLVEVGGEFIIGSSTNITNLEGLNNLETVGDFTLTGGTLVDITALESLTNVGNLTLTGFTSLEGFGSISNLTSINGDLRISCPAELLSLKGLENITHVEGDLIINESHGLACFKGLDGLVSIGGDLIVTNNDFLLSMSGMENLTSIGGLIRLENNDQLSYCNQSNICNLIDGTSILSNNDFGCNSLSEVNTNCSTPDAYPDDITLSSQAQLNEFAVMFPNYNNIVGTLNFELEEEVVNFNGLSQIETVGGDLLIKSENVFNYNPIENLIGFDNLTSVGGDFSIDWIEAINSIEALSALTSIGGDFTLRLLDSLQTLNGLENLQSVGGSLDINTCQKVIDISALGNLSQVETINLNDLTELESLDGLGNITAVPSYFYINRCNSLINFEGLNQLQTVGNRFVISDNENIVNCQGLENLSSVSEDFLVEGNKNLVNFNGISQLDTIGGDFVVDGSLSVDSLLNFSGMESLKYIGGKLRVRYNENLTSLLGLQNVETIAGGHVDFYFNVSLTNCAIPAVCNVLSDNDNIWTFGDSADGCNSVNQVRNVCNDSISKVTGMTYIDFNCNEVFDQGDTELSHHLIIKNNQPFAFTNDEATYERFLNPLSTTDIFVDDLYGFTASPEFHTITTSTDVFEYSNADFGFCPDSVFNNFSVDISPYNPPRPGFTNRYQICLLNQGTQSGNVSLSFDWSNNPTGDDATILSAAGGMINGNTIQWDFNDVLPFEPLCIDVQIELSTMTPLGTILNPRVQIETVAGNETTLADNIDMLNQEVVGSYDPNDKTVDKEEFITTDFINNETLEYRIRFQNTGTFPATFIEVLDTIQSNLDISTFKMIAASHSYEVSFPGENSIKWRFDNINLPDSTANEPESHGFIKFSIQTIEGLTVNDSISNRAAIYFDFNVPVITNYATTQIDLPVNTVSLINKIPLQIIPNPASEMVYLKFNTSENTSAQISILDLTGKIVKQLQSEISHTTDYKTQIPVNDLENGIYFIQVKSADSIGVGKVFIARE